MYYTLCDNVYLIDGYTNSCLYDLNSLKLYLLNTELRNWLKDVLCRGVSYEKLTDDQTIFLTRLVDDNLLEKSEYPDDSRVNRIPNKKAKIQFAWIEITTGCNLKCIHCYEEAKNNKGKQMRLEDFERVVDQLQSIGVRRIQLIGGEPFVLQDKLLEMIKIAYGKFQNIEIFTNGTLLTPKWIEIIKKYKVQIALSVYSYKDKEHDKVTCVPGSHKETNKAIKLLNYSGIKYRVCNVLMNGVDLGTKNTTYYELNPNKDVVRMTGRANVGLLNRDLILKKLITKEVFTKKINKNLFERLKSGNNCFSSKIYIDCELKVYPCVMERRFFHGSIQTQDLNNILSQDILLMDKNKVDGCKDCEYRYACFDCRPNTLGKSIFSKPWYCTYNPYSGKWNNPENHVKEILSLIDL